MKPLLRPRYVAAICLSLLFGGLLLDLTTTQRLVVAITYNIPIALSGLALQRRLILWTIVLALGANVAAGYENALALEGYDAITLLNRSLAALSFLIVGSATLAFFSAAERATRLVTEGHKGERERNLRLLTTRLSDKLEPHVLLSEAAREVRSLLKADAVVITGLQEQRFAAPRYSSPEDTGVAQQGHMASWMVDTLPLSDTPVITVRSDTGVMSVGRLSQGSGQDADELFIVAARPKTEEASLLLSEVIRGLEPLLRRARAFAQLQPDAS